MNKMEDIELSSTMMFDDIKKIDENGDEYWEARELQVLLGYKEWRWFANVIEKAQIACSKANLPIYRHFGVYSKIVKAGISTKEIIDYKLSRHACYLIVQNANPKYKNVSLGQNYFSVQTMRMEITDKEFLSLSEDEKRLYRRKQTRDGNKSLYKIAAKKGVRNFDRFTNKGYMGLYNGETADDIAKRKGLRYREEILDHMGSAELGANVFRITQTEEILSRQKEVSEELANDTHYNVGKSIRWVIKEFGNTMPEDLPTPEKSIKELEKEKSNVTQLKE